MDSISDHSPSLIGMAWFLTNSADNLSVVSGWMNEESFLGGGDTKGEGGSFFAVAKMIIYTLFKMLYLCKRGATFPEGLFPVGFQAK